LVTWEFLFALEAFCQGHGGEGIFSVAIRADLLDPTFGYWGAADDDLDARAKAAALQGLDNISLAGHGGGQQSGDADNVGAQFFGLGGESFKGNVHTKVNDVESARGKHGGDEGFANFVNVAFYGAEDYDSESLPRSSGFLEFGAENRGSRSHGCAGKDEVGKKHFTLLELFADDGETGSETTIDGEEGIETFADGAAGEFGGSVGIAIDDGLLHRLEKVGVHEGVASH
jgi:hypothetical protein